jgi:hypothetical protein
MLKEYRNTRYSKLYSLVSLLTLQFLFIAPIYSQTDSTSIEIESILDHLLQEPSEEADNSDLVEILEELTRNPVNINAATVYELQKLPSISAIEADIIVKHRERYGAFFSTYELYAIPQLTKETVDKIIPFVGVSKEVIVESIQPELSGFERFTADTKVYLRSRAITDLQTREGFLRNRYAGSKPKIYNRLNASYRNDYSFGILLEKDAGETSLTDFYSAYFVINSITPFSTILLGDYLAEFGQGLTLWSPYGFSKGSDAILTSKKRNRKIKPYTSTDENNFFRGAAVSLDYKSFSLATFYSNNTFDANIDSISGVVTSRPVDGLHRTENEIRRINSAKEIVFGLRTDYTHSNSLQLGFLFLNTSFSNEVVSSSTFGLSGKQFTYYSFSYDVLWNSINLFGEISYDGTSAASIAAIQFLLTRDFYFTTLLRNYPRNFNSLHGYGFGERSGNVQNEFGIYNGIKWRSPIGVINFYFDQWKFPYATFREPLPSSGNEYLFDIRSKPFYRVETNVRYKYEKKEIVGTSSGERILDTRYRQSLRGEIIFSLSNSLRLRSRVELNSFELENAQTNEKGLLLFQDIRFLPSSQLDFYWRIIFFRTDSFNSAVYEYENDLTGVLSNFAMYGEGLRWYLIVRFKPINIMSLSLKYSETFKPGETYLSSGDSRINGNLDNRISFQLDIRF